MAVHANRWPPRRRLSVAFFRLFSWPFGVGHAPHTSYPEFQLDLRPGVRPTTDEQIDRALRTIPGLEDRVVATLRTFLRELFTPHDGAPEVGITVESKQLRVEIFPRTPDGHPQPGLVTLAGRWNLQPNARGRLVLTIDRTA